MKRALAWFRQLKDKSGSCDHADKGGITRGWSSGLATILVFWGINLFIGIYWQQCVPVNIWSSQMLSALSQLKGSRQSPEIVLVGSSLVRYPMWHADLKHKVSPSGAHFETYHGAKWLQHELDKAGLGTVRIFDLAMDGASTSDVYLICDKLLKGPHCPKLIIYGIADRDIASGVFHSERSDPAFNLLFESRDCWRLGHLFTTNIQERIDLELYERCSLYKRRQLIKEGAVGLAHWIEDSLSTVSNANAIASEQLNHVIAEKDQAFVSSYSQAWASSKKLVKNQEKSLLLLSRLAEKRNCSLLLVNMPMERGIPVGSKNYERYRQLLDICAQRPNTYLMDLASHGSAFQSECFLDGSHMNAVGGEQLISRLAEWIEKHKTTVPCS